MQLQTNQHENRKFITILADGKLHQTVPEGTEGSVVRKYEDKEGVEQSKNELVFESVTGLITGIKFEDSDFGTSLQVSIDNDGVLSMGTASNFGEDFMKKLPSIDPTRPVKITPYSFVDEKGKSRKGVSIVQGEQKIESFYFDKETKSLINGMPAPEGDTTKYKSDDWKIYFMQVRKFLVAETEKLASKFTFEPRNEVEAETGEITLEDF